MLLIGFLQDEKLVSEIKTTDGIILLDSVPNNSLYKYYSAADFAIWPNHVTISHFEAMACRLPIIVSNLEVAKERVVWENGFFLNSLSVDEIYEKSKLMIINQPMRKQMGERALKAINNELSWDVIVNKFLP